jgi:hypothetical protein
VVPGARSNEEFRYDRVLMAAKDFRPATAFPLLVLRTERTERYQVLRS